MHPCTPQYQRFFIPAIRFDLLAPPSKCSSTSLFFSMLCTCSLITSSLPSFSSSDSRALSLTIRAIPCACCSCGQIWRDNGLETFDFVCLLLVGFVQVGLWGLGGSIGFGGDVEFLVGVLRFRGVGLRRSRDSCIGCGAGLGLDSWIESRHICVELGE
jgi:hypothetical protein